MYTSVQECIDPIFRDIQDYSVVDTHNKRRILRGMPDLCIFRGQVSPVNLSAFVELKTKGSFSDESYGQALDYLIQMNRYQPSRKYMIGMISSISNNSIIILTYVASHHRSISSLDAERPDCIPKITLHTNLQFAQAISIPYQYLQRPEYRPPNLKFSEDIGALERVLGYPRRSMVMAVKVAIKNDRNTFEKEIKVLRRIAEGYPEITVPSCLPQLVHDNPARLEFGIISWIHERGIIHRDLRADNLIIVSPQTEIRLARKSGYGNSEFKGFPSRAAVVLVDSTALRRLQKRELARGGSDSPSPTYRYNSMSKDTFLSGDEDYAAFNYDEDEDDHRSEKDKERNELAAVLFTASQLRLRFPLEVTEYTPQKSDDSLSFVLLLVNLLFPHTFDAFQY
ncbi:hypothetical protein BDD12DRAFT_898393 [Trichophaea hybrida]|nr:hypothetical protein BDD12DRAFT_898393 [Trichophaea hybrida]